MALHTDAPPVVFAPEVREGTSHSDEIRNPREVGGAFFVFDVTAVPPAPRAKKEEETAEEKAELKAEEEAREGTLNVVIEAKDEISDKWVPITAFAVTKKASENPVGKLAYTIYAGALETAALANHEVQGLPLPRAWRATVEHSKQVGEWTYSLSYQQLNA